MAQTKTRLSVGLGYGHLSMAGLLRMTGHRLRLRQLPVFRLASSERQPTRAQGQNSG